MNYKASHTRVSIKYSQRHIKIHMTNTADGIVYNNGRDKQSNATKRKEETVIDKGKKIHSRTAPAIADKSGQDTRQLFRKTKGPSFVLMTQFIFSRLASTEKPIERYKKQ